MKSKLVLITTLASFYSFCLAADQYLVLSGGDNPGLNNYSQYLQTKTVYDYLSSKYLSQNISLFFGAGNTPETKDPLLDVHVVKNTVQHINDKTDSLVVGAIANNRPADKTSVTQYFVTDNIQNLQSTQNLWLFISDHGMPNYFMDNKELDPYRNNCIDLWHYQTPFINNFLNSSDFYQSCLSRQELTALLSPLKAKHIIFEMSQCYSGGFHQLSVTMQNGYPSADPHICGFTAATPDHFASGCTADANGATYQGYERSFTEWYTGKNVITGQKVRDPAATIFNAHQNAALEDMTVDVPITTSDYYLLQWANAFTNSEFVSRVSGNNAEKIRDIYTHYQQYLNQLKDPALRAFQQFLQKNEIAVQKRVPEASSFIKLSLSAQQQAITRMETVNQEMIDKSDTLSAGMMNLYRRAILPNWNKVIADKNTTPLTTKQMSFERELYSKIITENLLLNPNQLTMYYLQYLSQNHNDPELMLYHKNRLEFMQQWAKKHNQAIFFNAINQFKQLNNELTELSDKIALAEKNKQLLKRLMTYQKILAAWVTLEKINDKKALEELQGLLSCEHS